MSLTAQNGREYKYDIESLELSSRNCNLNTNQLYQLHLLVHNRKISWDDTLSQVDTLQSYLGYDNGEMVSALREIYYEEALDFFIKGAKDIGSDFYATQGNQNGISDADASFARTALMLTTQGKEYAPALVKIQHPKGYEAEGEFALDHVVAALDGSFNDNTGHVYLGWKGEAFAAMVDLDSKNIATLPAVTWQGDLAASTAKAYEHGSSARGYEIEFPPEDFEGDMLGVVLANGGAIQQSGTNLAQELSSALASDSPYVAQKYSKFADALGFDFENGKISPEDKQQFLTDNQEIVSDLGSGFYGKTTFDPMILLLEGQEAIHSYATEQINYFIEQLEQGLQAEVNK